MRALVSQARAEMLLTLRRGESLLLIIAVPMLLLAFFSTVDVLPKGGFPDSITYLAPGVLALSVMSTGMVQLAIGTAFERQYGVLKRLGATPLGRPRLLGAKTISIIAVELVQVAVLVALALALGWDPSVRVAAVLALLLGTVAFAGLGLLMAGCLRGEVTLAAANGLYLVLLLLGGMVVPLSELPGWLRSIAELLPAGALVGALTGSLTRGFSVATRDWIVLTAWAVAAPVAASRFFRWE
ncbi:MAG: ABC transporter permease [Acidimicrobiales bacterium]